MLLIRVFYNPILLDCEVFEKFMMYLTYHNTAYVTKSGVFIPIRQ